MLPCRRPWQLAQCTVVDAWAALRRHYFCRHVQLTSTSPSDCLPHTLSRSRARELVPLSTPSGSTPPRRPPRYVVLTASSTLCGLYGLTTSRAPGANGCPLAVGPSTTRRAVVGIISRGASLLVSRDLSGLLTHETPVFRPLSSTCVPCSGGDLHLACLQLSSSVVCCIRSHRFL